VEPGEQALVRRVNGGVRPCPVRGVGLPVGGDRLLELPLGRAALGQQADERRPLREEAAGHRPQVPLEPARIPLANLGPALLQEGGQPLPVCSLLEEIHRVRRVGVGPREQRRGRPAAQLVDPALAQLRPELAEQEPADRLLVNGEPAGRLGGPEKGGLLDEALERDPCPPRPQRRLQEPDVEPAEERDAAEQRLGWRVERCVGGSGRRSPPAAGWPPGGG
jgi:hypothetical protein